MPASKAHPHLIFADGVINDVAGAANVRLQKAQVCHDAYSSETNDGCRNVGSGNLAERPQSCESQVERQA